MSYSAQAQLSVDADFIARVTACAAVEIPVIYDAKTWTETYIWRIAAAPGFADAYEYAINSEQPRPWQGSCGDHRRPDPRSGAGVVRRTQPSTARTS